jgi:hypothetical protein
MRVILLLIAITTGLTLLAGCDKPVHEASTPIHWAIDR